jgi:hypothetical protein
MIEAIGLTKDYGAKRAVDGLNLHRSAGDRHRVPRPERGDRDFRIS